MKRIVKEDSLHQLHQNENKMDSLLGISFIPQRFRLHFICREGKLPDFLVYSILEIRWKVNIKNEKLEP